MSAANGPTSTSQSCSQWLGLIVMGSARPALQNLRTSSIPTSRQKGTCAYQAGESVRPGSIPQALPVLDKRQEAREHLTMSTTMYRDMGMTYWLERAEAELRKSG
jgi:hypothetical protein